MTSGVYLRTKKHKEIIEKNGRKNWWKKGHKINVGKKYKIGRFCGPHSKKTKLKISEARRQYLQNHPEIRKKLSEALRGEKSPNWQGGKSFEPYTTDWTKTLRQSIRERDHYICQLCKKLQGDRVHSVHHIDYDKKNCNPNNLITLCVSCNSKVNKNRKYWNDYFLELL